MAVGCRRVRRLAASKASPRTVAQAAMRAATALCRPRPAPKVAEPCYSLRRKINNAHHLLSSFRSALRCTQSASVALDAVVRKPPPGGLLPHCRLLASCRMSLTSRITYFCAGMRNRPEAKTGEIGLSAKPGPKRRVRRRPFAQGLFESCCRPRLLGALRLQHASLDLEATPTDLKGND